MKIDPVVEALENASKIIDLLVVNYLKVAPKNDDELEREKECIHIAKLIDHQALPLARKQAEFIEAFDEWLKGTLTTNHRGRWKMYKLRQELQALEDSNDD